MKLKVCGINEPHFAAEAERRGVDYLGFIFHPSSPRNVSVERAAEITATLTGKAKRVGVFVRQSTEEILAVMKAAALDVVQLHRRASAEDVDKLKAAGYEVWTLAGGAEGDGVLFDSSHGDGETAFKKGAYKAILAGRIGRENLAEALQKEPDILDVNSSLESAPGVKEISRLTEFLAAF